MRGPLVRGCWLAVALLAAACQALAPPDMDAVREMEKGLDAIPYDAKEGGIAEERFLAFLEVRRKIDQAERPGSADREELRRANEYNRATTAQIRRVQAHTNRIVAARANALTDAKMGFPEYRHIMDALADLPWEPEAFREDGLSPVQLANARLFQAHASEIRGVMDVDAIRRQRAKTRSEQGR